MKSLTLEIRTPEKVRFFDRVQSLYARASDGEIGILPDHAALATKLEPGPLRFVRESGEEVRLDGTEGFLIVNRNNVSVLLRS